MHGMVKANDCPVCLRTQVGAPPATRHPCLHCARALRKGVWRTYTEIVDVTSQRAAIDTRTSMGDERPVPVEACEDAGWLFEGRRMYGLDEAAQLAGLLPPRVLTVRQVWQEYLPPDVWRRWFAPHYREEQP